MKYIVWSGRKNIWKRKSGRNKGRGKKRLTTAVRRIKVRRNRCGLGWDDWV
jgi:hypothetical protein